MLEGYTLSANHKCIFIKLWIIQFKCFVTLEIDFTTQQVDNNFRNS